MSLHCYMHLDYIQSGISVFCPSTLKGEKVYKGLEKVTEGLR